MLLYLSQRYAKIWLQDENLSEEVAGGRVFSTLVLDVA
jgi:hypothetical protein